jgi:Putative auto-transporter adhesin, head GIN domain
MKFRFSIIMFFFLALQVGAQSQLNRLTNPAIPIVAEDGIRQISVAGNIDVVLIQGDEESVGVKVAPGSIHKIYFSMFNDHLYLSPSVDMQGDERVKVYVNINTLDKIKLEGSASAMSTNILSAGDLHVFLGPQAKINLRTSQQVRVHGDNAYESFEQKGYYGVYSKE